MKKLLMLVMTVILVLICTGIETPKIIEHEIYIPPNSAIDGVVHTGSFDILKVGEDEYEHVMDRLGEVYGECVRMRATEATIDRVLSRYNVRIVDSYNEGDKRVIYGYSTAISGGVVHRGRLVNIQLNCGNNMVEIGTPLIMGSY